MSKEVNFKVLKKCKKEHSASRQTNGLKTSVSASSSNNHSDAIDTSDVNESHNEDSHRIVEQEEENYQGKCKKHARNMQHGATLKDK